MYEKFLSFLRLDRMICKGNKQENPRNKINNFLPHFSRKINNLIQSIIFLLFPLKYINIYL